MPIPRKLFLASLPFTHAVTRSPRVAFLGRRVMRLAGALAVAWGRGKPRTSVADVGRQWHRLFPLGDDLPITEITEDTVYAEIRIRCPYRGSSNVDGCYRMMEYDRKILDDIGGQLVILRSQAEPGVKVCKLAIRMRDADIADLEHAHERVRRARD